MCIYVDKNDIEHSFDSFDDMVNFIKNDDIEAYNFLIDQLKEDYEFLNIFLEES